MIDMPYHMSAWHSWGHKIYEYANKYEHYLFTEDTAFDFARELQEIARNLRNGGDIEVFDFDGQIAEEDGCKVVIRPRIQVGHEFYIPFIRIEGERL